MRTIFVFLWLIFSLNFSAVFAQEKIGENVIPTEAATPAVSLTPMRLVSSYEFALSISTLVFGLIVLAMGLYIIMKKRVSFDNAIRFMTLTLIISSTLFLITAGYSNDQLAPALGLLGTIAGYLLGKNQEREATNEKNA